MSLGAADIAYWQQRWAEGQTGFHRDAVNADLVAHWQRLALPAGSAVFVPLCGASPDLAWLAAQGHAVVGVEASEVAVARFFADHGLVPARETQAHGTRFEAGGITICCGDLFAMPTALWAGCAAVYDRAAWIALPPALWPAYAQAVYAPLAAGAQALLLGITYPQEELAGPPFSVPVAEVRVLLEPAWRLTELDARTASLADFPKFRDAGVSRLTEHTLLLRKLP